MITTKTKNRYVIRASYDGKTKFLSKNWELTKKLGKAALYKTEKKAVQNLELCKTVYNETCGDDPHPGRLEKLQDTTIMPVTIKITKEYTL